MTSVNERITWRTLCIFGDSITEGAGDETGRGWVDRLKANWKTPRPDGSDRPNVYNLGIDGDRTADVLARIESEAAARNAGSIIIAVGANDLPWTGREPTPQATFKHQYQELLGTALKFTSRVLVVGLLRVDESAGDHGIRNDDVQSLNRLIAGMATDVQVEVLDVYDLLDNTDFADGVHPNHSGYEKLYQRINAELEQRGWH